MAKHQRIAPSEQHAPACFAFYMEVEEALTRHKIAPTRFGTDATGDRRLVFQLRQGRRLREDTIERVRRHIDKLDLARVLARFGSVDEGIDHLVDVLIEAKDRQEGDTDSEANGDELDGGNSEDDFIRRQSHSRVPGHSRHCPEVAVD